MKNSKLKIRTAPAIVGYTVLWCRAFFRRIKLNLQIKYLHFRNPKATYIFWYSKRQYRILTDTFPSNPFAQGRPLFKGKKYSEAREIGKGLCNWNDAVIVGIGRIDDIQLSNPVLLKYERLPNPIVENCEMFTKWW